MTTIAQYKNDVAEAFTKIKTLDELRAENNMVNEVFLISRKIFDNDLDTMSLGWLLSNGGKLASIYAYLGNKYAVARAERDIYEQKKDEVLNRLTTEYYGDSESKITLARARAKLEIASIEEMITIKEYEKKSMENLLSATERLVGFIQSAIKVKQSEKYVGQNLHDNM